MDKLIALLADLFRSLFGNRLGITGDTAAISPQLEFLQHRRELSNTKVWMLDIFEKNVVDRFTTREIFDVWSPLVINRTQAEEADVTLDGCFTRLQDLEEKGFIEMETTRQGKVWFITLIYSDTLIEREAELTVMAPIDEQDLR